MCGAEYHKLVNSLFLQESLFGSPFTFTQINLSDFMLLDFFRLSHFSNAVLHQKQNIQQHSKTTKILLPGTVETGGRCFRLLSLHGQGGTPNRSDAKVARGSVCETCACARARRTLHVKNSGWAPSSCDHKFSRATAAETHVKVSCERGKKHVGYESVQGKTFTFPIYLWSSNT